jgi:hypothetical protein
LPLLLLSLLLSLLLLLPPRSAFAFHAVIVFCTLGHLAATTTTSQFAGPGPSAPRRLPGPRLQLSENRHRDPVIPWARLLSHGP